MARASWRKKCNLKTERKPKPKGLATARPTTLALNVVGVSAVAGMVTVEQLGLTSAPTATEGRTLQWRYI